MTFRISLEVNLYLDNNFINSEYNISACASPASSGPISSTVFEMYVEVEYKGNLVSQLEIKISEIMDEIQACQCELFL